MPFVIRTDKLSRPHYWAGVAEGNIGLVIAMSPIIGNAWPIDERIEAERVLKDLGEDWTISEISTPKISRGLQRRRA